jgi:hypothetical protein
MCIHHTHTHTYMCVYVFVCVWVWVWVWVCVCVCLCVSVCEYTGGETAVANLFTAVQSAAKSRLFPPKSRYLYRV